MLTDQEATVLAKLADYVASFDRAGHTPQEFWDGFFSIAEEIRAEAFSNAGHVEVRERYFDIITAADDAGYCVPMTLMHSPLSSPAADAGD
jgi:hypothetical protein